MAIRLWPQDYERKDHITKAEKGILRYAARNFQNGHMVVGIDPVGLSGERVKLGMYISPSEGLVTFSIYSGMINAMPVFSYIAYVQMVEGKIYERLLDSKLLIVRNGEKKALKFPYKHIVMFPDEVVGKTTVSKDDLQQLRNYATFDSFRPITSDGKEKRIEDLKIFAGIRKAYDKTFKSLSELECRAIFERLAPEYTVVLNETINVCVAEKKTLVTEADLRITGKELEYKTFFLDEYQVGVVNDMGKGHRVILANPGAGKSVLLLSKAFKYASLYKGSNVLLTCYNSNLADSYNFNRSCANFGKDIKLFIMTFHKLVKKIYEECLRSHCASNIATEEEIQKCIDMVKQGKVKLRFKAIFIDEVQIFDPLYLELCYRLLEDDDDRVFLMAGDLNQAVRALSRKGDAPWKRMNGIQLDFTGRVRYIENNYRNSQEIGEYISHMLQHMNTRLSMLELINSLEYEYNSFKVGTNPTIALKVRTGVQRTSIKTSVIAAIKEIATTYRITDSNLNHTGIYLYSKGKIMIHLTFDYKTDEKCTTPGQYLKYHRTFQGLSTRELAEKVGIVPATLVLYENDRHPIKHSTAVALANALGIDRNRLLDKYTAFVDYPYSSLLKKVRQDLSLTQIQMAELIGIGQTSYSGWEREIRVPRRKEYDKILAALEKLRVNVDTYLCQSASI